MAAPDLPPVLLIADDDPGALADVVAPARWTIRSGFGLPTEPWDLATHRWLCVGEVGDEDDARHALTAVARGAGIAIVVTLPGAARHRFLEDLHKLAEPMPYVAPTASTEPALRPAHEELLAAVAGGATVTAAAADLHMSRRTANRLLAEARAAYGVDSTAAAVSRWQASNRP